jgi:hypothetical protein
MENKITVSNTELVSIINDSGITTLIEPLVKEIFLFDTYIAGTSYIEEKEIFQSLKVNDHLILRRDKENKFDEKAILVLNEKKIKLGFIPRKDNEIFSRLLDAGKLLTGTVKEINIKGDIYKIKININLIDF